MRTSLLVAFAAVSMLSARALALPSSNNTDKSVTGDSGLHLRTFKAVDTCSGVDFSWGWSLTSGCDDGDVCTENHTVGINPAYNDMCCRNRNIFCDAKGNLKSAAEIEAIKAQVAAEDEQVANVFTPGTVDTYWGYASGTVRSPNNGRAVSAHARLDACLHYIDVDTITASGWNLAGEQGCETNCGNGNVNEYCNQNSAAVCKDRCACLYQVNGVGSLTCNNL
jgi:hypothetical protein